MRIQHPAVQSDVFRLLTVLEFDLVIEDHFLPTRVELFQNTEHKRRFRCRLWEREICHLQLTLAKTKAKGRSESDEEILVERTWELSDKFEDFEAPNARSALRVFLNALKRYLDRAAV